MVAGRVAAAGPFTGIVLCGGRSSRMGRDKALIEIDGVPMARRVADVLRSAGATEVLAIGGDRAALGRLGLDVRPDDHPGDGPLPATITALRAAREELVMVASCDLLHPSQPAVAATVEALRAEAGAAGCVPIVDGHRQWTHAAWRRTAAGGLIEAYEAGARSLHRAAADLVLVAGTDIGSLATADADAPGDLPRPSGR